MSGDTVAVVSERGVHTEWGDKPMLGAFTLPKVLAWARERQVAQLWIHPAFQGPRESFLDTYRAAILAGWNLPAEPQPWANTWQAGTYGRVSLVLPALETRAPWKDARDGADLLAALVAFRRAVGIVYRSSPGATGTALMRECAPKTDLSASVAPAEMPAPARDRTTEQDLYWMRPLTDEERGHRYVHAFDKNAMYLAACSGLRLGFGKPERREPEPGAYDRMPGYWRVEVLPRPAQLDTLLPPIARLCDPQWMATPRAVLLDDEGYVMKLHEAYIWPKSHQPLEPWYKRLRAARTSLQQEASIAAPWNHSNALAYRVLKTVYTQAIGWLDGGWMREGDEPADLFRPDWRHAIIAAARANLYRNIVKAYRQSGRAPFAVATDCLYYTSEDEWADGLHNEMGLRMGNAPGEYKVAHEGVPLADVRGAIEMGGTRGLRVLQRRLKGTEGASDGES